jgi:hypothetical protein
MLNQLPVSITAAPLRTPKMIKRILVLSSIIVGFMLLYLNLYASDAVEVSTNTKNADIKHLIKLMGGNDLKKNILKKMLTKSKPGTARNSLEFYDRFNVEGNDSVLIDKIAEKYDQYLTHAEVKELIVFFKTPIGQKYVQVSPIISDETNKLSAQWGEETRVKVIQKMMDEGYFEPENQERIP